MQARLLFLIAASLLLAYPACAAELSPGGIAASLPLAVPGFEPPPKLPVDMAPKAEAVPSCLVSEDQLPDNFLHLMQKLESPITSTALGATPTEAEAPTLPQNRPATGQTALPTTSTSQGGSITRSRESGVTVYRGRN